jgi:proteasome accessory factor B
MATCWKKYSLGETEEITIRFSPEAASDIKRKKWHPSQKITDNKDGSIDFTVTISGHDEIMKWILSWGSKAKVISPKELKEKIKKEASCIAKQ